MADHLPCVSVGSEFSSFEELSRAIKLWEEECVILYTRNSRTVATYQKRAPKRHMNDDLIYSELDYACVYGGREYNS
uniref:ZSWIM3 N-terminal domain-containing protein n=1 Tax=Amphimedon queenslandica TaxID=400682 RepID=A0A1X7VT39_AMPQE